VDYEQSAVPDTGFADAGRQYGRYDNERGQRWYQPQRQYQRGEQYRRQYQRGEY
jgi:hypothetical protein